MMSWNGDHMNGFGWLLMTLGVAALCGVLLIGTVLLVRALRPAAPASTPVHPAARPTPEQVLADRFASGEMAEADYTGRLATLHRPGRS